MNFKRKTRETIAILLAAGKGERFGGSVPKQFELLGGKPLFHYALKTFCEHSEIDRVYLVVPEGNENIEVPYYAKFAGILIGGAERYLSVWNALQKIPFQSDNRILIHDVARPFANSEIISRVLKALDDAAGVTPAMKVNDSLMNLQTQRIVDRSTYLAVQTPQGFRADELFGVMKAITEAHSLPSFPKSEFEAFQFCAPKSILKTIEGSRWNFKITTQEDWKLAEIILKEKVLQKTASSRE